MFSPLATAKGAGATPACPGVTWGAGLDVTITGKCTLKANQSARKVTIAAGGELVFDPASSVTLTLTGSMVVQGKLTMRPADATKVHKILFSGINEANFVGGGDIILADTDIGLWVDTTGVLDLVGTYRKAWLRTSAGRTAGQTTLPFSVKPAGWQAGDELVVCPTEAPSVVDFDDHFDERTVSSITGNTVTLNSGLTFDHPSVTIAPAKGELPAITYTPEVLNLTRNVLIEGEPGKRAHIWFALSMQNPQTIRYVGLRYLGPRSSATPETGLILGRYALHFHKSGTGMGPQAFEGVVARDIGSHAYVIHSTSDVTLLDAVAYKFPESAYWWDPAQSPNSIRNVFDRCVAARGYVGMTGNSFRAQMFTVGDPNPASAADRNTIRRCVAVGQQGGTPAQGFSTSGFHWTETNTGVWVFEDNVAHNNTAHGIFNWQNDTEAHILSRVHSFHNGGRGVHHGAYNNVYRFEDSVFYGNGTGQTSVSAMSDGAVPGGTQRRRQTWERVVFDGAGVTSNVFINGDHSTDPEPAVQVKRCTFKGYVDRAVYLPVQGNADNFDFLDCDFGTGNWFFLDDLTLPDSVVYVKDADEEFILRDKDVAGGTLVTAWNAKKFLVPGEVITDAAVWLEAADLLATHADGDPVGTWTDKSVNGRNATQATAAAKPTFKRNEQGRPVLRFDGVDDYLDIDGLTLDLDAGDFTIMVIASMTRDATTRTLLAQRDGTGSGRSFIRKASTNAIDILPFGWSFITGGNYYFFGGMRPELWVTWRNGTAGQGRREEWPAIGGQGNLTYVSQPANGGWRIGATKVPDQFLNGDVVAVLVWARQLARWERRTVGAYLAHKYGLW